MGIAIKVLNSNGEVVMYFKDASVHTGVRNGVSEITVFDDPSVCRRLIVPAGFIVDTTAYSGEPPEAPDMNPETPDMNDDPDFSLKGIDIKKYNIR